MRLLVLLAFMAALLMALVTGIARDLWRVLRALVLYLWAVVCRR